MPIVVVGTVFVDIKGFPDNVYIPAGRNAGSVEFVHGGVGRNLVEDIANVELRPRFVSMVDDTAQGSEVLSRLERHKVDTRFVVTVPDGMGIWLANFRCGGDVIGSISKRPAMEAMASLLAEKGDQIFSDADSIVLEIDLDKEIVKQVLAYAEKYGKKVIAVVANMSIASQRRDLLRRIDCFVCNAQEAGILFADDSMQSMEPGQLCRELGGRIVSAGIRSMVVTMGSRGSVYASAEGESGICPARAVQVKDTTGAGDAFCAGVAVALTYGKNLAEASAIGTRLASSVITVNENVCPRFQPEELGIDAGKKGRNMLTCAAGAAQEAF